MPGPALHTGAVVTCMHGGPAQPTAPFPRVLVSGQPVATISAPYVVTGCGLTGTTVPPCVTGQWVVGATRVLAGGVPVVLFTGQSVCVPTCTPMLPMSSQTRVIMT